MKNKLTLSSVEKMRKRLEYLKSEVSRSEGVIDSELKRLSDEFGFRTVEEGRAAQAKLKKKVVIAKSAFMKSLGAYEKEWCDE